MTAKGLTVRTKEKNKGEGQRARGCCCKELAAAVVVMDKFAGETSPKRHTPKRNSSSQREEGLKDQNWKKSDNDCLLKEMCVYVCV